MRGYVFESNKTDVCLWNDPLVAIAHGGIVLMVNRRNNSFERSMSSISDKAFIPGMNLVVLYSTSRHLFALFRFLKGVTSGVYLVITVFEKNCENLFANVTDVGRQLTPYCRTVQDG